MALGKIDATLRRDEVGHAQGVDDVVDLEVEEIDREAEPLDRGKLDHAADELHLALLGLEVGVAADGGSCESGVRASKRCAADRAKAAVVVADGLRLRKAGRCPGALNDSE